MMPLYVRVFSRAAAISKHVSAQMLFFLAVSEIALLSGLQFLLDLLLSPVGAYGLKINLLACVRFYLFLVRARLYYQ